MIHTGTSAPRRPKYVSNSSWFFAAGSLSNGVVYRRSCGGMTLRFGFDASFSRCAAFTALRHSHATDTAPDTRNSKGLRAANMVEGRRRERGKEGGRREPLPHCGAVELKEGKKGQQRSPRNKKKMAGNCRRWKVNGIYVVKGCR